jgi:hypothetical protein
MSLADHGGGWQAYRQVTDGSGSVQATLRALGEASPSSHFFERTLSTGELTAL